MARHSSNLDVFGASSTAETVDKGAGKTGHGVASSSLPVKRNLIFNP